MAHIYTALLFNAYGISMKQNPFLGAEEERTLIASAQQGVQRARDRLVLSHLPLALKRAAMVAKSAEEATDLGQSAMEGLLIAVDNYELPRYSVRFATFATWWVRAKITEAVLRSRYATRLPANVKVKNLIRDMMMVQQMLHRQGLAGTPAQVSQALLQKGHKAAVVQSIMLAMASTISFDTPIGGTDNDHDDRTVGDSIADPSNLEEDMMQLFTEREDAARLSVLLQRLDDRQRRIIVRRFGLDGAEPVTLEILSDELGVSKERVRQIEAKSLAIMRSPEPPVRKRGGRQRKVTA